MSYFPLTAPSFNVRIRWPKNTYIKTAAQRSFDPNVGPAEVARNHTGFRFIPHGDKLVLINEGGYLRAASVRFEVVGRISSDRYAPDCILSHCAGHLALGFPIRIRSVVGIAQVTTINPLS